MTQLISIIIAAMLSVAMPSAGTDVPSLEGRSIAFIGDSICYGTNYEGGYAKIIGGENNMTVTNPSRGGASIARNVRWSADGDGIRPCIIDMADSLEGSYDFIIAEGGINDFWNHVPLGELTDGFEGGYDDTTFAGGMETLFSGIKTNHPEIRAGFVIIHDPFTYDAEDAFAPYYEMMKSACDKWSVPYLDLYAANNQETGVNVRDEAMNLKYFGSQSRPQGDGTHPNELGYRTIYAEPMTEWLAGLLR